jgi:AraC family transcriptional regulator, exoenzyme S synthesis regulatory protein ExsA
MEPLYRFPEGFLVSNFGQAAQELTAASALIQLRSVSKTFKNREVYTLPNYVLFIPLLGQKIFYAQAKALAVEAGDVLFIRRNAPISCDLTRLDQGRFEALMFYIEPEFIAAILQKYQIHLKAIPRVQDLCALKVTPLLKNCIESLLPLYLHTAKHAEALIQLKMEELLLHLLEGEEADPLLALLASASQSELHPYLELIENCLAEPMTIEQMAQALHQSPTAFKKEFKRIFGLPPAQYLLEKRLERAAQMLNFSEQSITEIGLANGFESTSHFIQAFKKRFAATPRQYKMSKLDSF